MAYRLNYSDYSTSSGPPDPSAWVGPPGPMGPPGPTGSDGAIGPIGPMGPSGVTGSMPEAPTDGAVYGRQGSSGSWLGALPLGSGGTVAGPTSFLNASTSNPVAPGFASSARYGTQSARDIFAKTLNVPPRNTFNVLEGVLTLPATVTDNLTYHTAICAFVDQYSSGGVAYGIGSHCVAEASNSTLGGFGNLCVDSPLQSGAFTNVRMQNEFDWYTSNVGTSVRATLHDGYFLAQPNSPISLIAFSNNVFTGPLVIGTASFSGTTMTVTAISSGTFRAGMRLEATGVDGTLNIIILPFGTTDPNTSAPSTGTGSTGTYVVSAAVGVIASTTVRASMTFQWNIFAQSPDGVSQVALDIGQRNVATSLTVGGRSQLVQWRFSDTTVANERIMQQWVEPLPSGGVLYLRAFNTNTPACYGIQNNGLNGAGFLSQNHANTGWIDMLHLDASDRTIVGAGSVTTFMNTTQGTGLQVLDDGVASTNALAVKGGTAASPARIYAAATNIQFANGALAPSSTSGFVSPYPVCNGTPTGIPIRTSSAAAYGVYNTASKSLNIYDTLTSSWYHVTLTAGAA